VPGCEQHLVSHSYWVRLLVASMNGWYEAQEGEQGVASVVAARITGWLWHVTQLQEAVYSCQGNYMHAQYCIANLHCGSIVH
jgi:hypothetical protein